VTFADNVKHGRQTAPLHNAAEMPPYRSPRDGRLDRRIKGAHMGFRISAALLTAALVLPQSATAALEPQQVFTADYAVSFYGITVARSTVVSKLGTTSYSVDGSIRSAGLAAFFASTNAETKVSGKIGKSGVSPDSYSVDYVYGKKNKKTSLQFARGNVVKVSNSPPLPPRRPDWVAVGAKELLAVADPISATLIEAKDARSVCGRTIKAFDGEIRADLALTYVNTAPVSIGGTTVDAVTCQGRFKPVAGYHRGNKSIQYLSTKSKIMMKFAQLGKTGIYAPILATVGTKVGTFTIRARKFEATK
jgi:hypothetical protein